MPVASARGAPQPEQLSAARVTVGVTVGVTTPLRYAAQLHAQPLCEVSRNVP